jgi:regulator of sigma E protease
LSDVREFAALAAGEEAVFTVERGGSSIDLGVTVGRETRADGFGGETSLGYIGLAPGVPTILGESASGSPAAAAGFERGDRIVSVDGQAIDYFIELQRYLEDAGAGAATFTVERDGRRVELIADIELRPISDPLPGEPDSYPYLGWRGDADATILVDRYGPIGAVKQGAAWTWRAAVLPARYVGRIFQGKESGAELGGPLRMANTAGNIAATAWSSADGDPLAGASSALFQLVLLAGALSVAIGLINLLPIPVLDGGHLVYYAYEAVAGRPLGEGAQEWGFRIGLAMVMGLMVFAFWNDLKYLRVFETIGQLLS